MRATAIVLLLALTLATMFSVECVQQTKQMVDCSDYKKLPPGQERFCHHMYELICGSDGKTYKNDCFFCSQVKKTDGKLKFVHYGKC
ncbi:serine protease inhibitor Kazal-type 9 [Theropithecus gelada]|uniref:Serine peptidase inhibitor Kazal type 9 n=1 Tax=Theropithecus gelada TaxID=9565 RepID=A0A8D2E320_THEGE|nr:serine protease inhibitor Kazal-type 9 [Theropithecus gelada]